MAKLSPKTIAQAIYKTAKDKSGTELERALQLSVEFLAKKNWLSKTPEILKHLEQVKNQDLGIVSAKVTSCAPLTKYTSDEVKHALKKRYKAEDVIVELQEDKKLIGGIKIEANDEVIDLSFKNKLNQLQNHLLTH